MRGPFLRDERAPSIRYPWSRTVLTSLLGLLLPFVWVFETSSCAPDSAERRERTGAELLAQAIDGDGPALPLVLVIACLATPWIAAGVVRAAPRFLALLGGAVAALATTGFGFFVLLFTIFNARTLRPAGFAAAALLTAVSLDGLARLWLGAREWLASARATSARATAGEAGRPSAKGAASEDAGADQEEDDDDDDDEGGEAPPGHD